MTVEADGGLRRVPRLGEHAPTRIELSLGPSYRPSERWRLCRDDASAVGYRSCITWNPPGVRERMGKKRDIGQVEANAREFGMRADERREVGDYVEECKRAGVAGSGPNGDYTYAELRVRAEEFRGGTA